MKNEPIEKQKWDETAEMLGSETYKIGEHWAYNFRNDPRRLGFVLSRYKFAAKMSRKEGSVLELGCGEGIGAPILAENASHYTGVDLDDAAILMARENFNPEKFTYLYDDFMGKCFGDFQTVVSLDVVEHIYEEYEAIYFETLCKNLVEEGVVIVGTPNATAAPYASEASNLGHVNLFTQKRLKETLERYFHNVFPFGINDEMVHTGFGDMSHYLICVACNKREL